MLLTAGTKFMAEISGYNGCPCHNEIFLLNSKTEVMAVEPNLRPAGGKIWDLSTYAFENFDPWVSWIQWAAGKVDNTPKKLKHKCYAGMRFIIARKDGEIKNINISNDGEFAKLMKDSIFMIPKPSFLGYVTAKSGDYNRLASTLLAAEELLSNNCVFND